MTIDSGVYVIGSLNPSLIGVELQEADMTKFKVGDRVRTKLGSAFFKKGETGTVCEEDGRPWVHFDNPHVDRDTFFYSRGCAVSQEDLELIPQARTRAEIEAEIAKLQAEMAVLPREPERLWGVRKCGASESELITPTKGAAARAMRDGCEIVEFVEVMK